MKKRAIVLLFPLLTLLLELLPYGAVCVFAHPTDDGSIEHLRELYSYFDLVPFGYANIAPLLTGVLTASLLLLLAIYVCTGSEQLLVAASCLLLLAVPLSLAPLLFGIRFFSVVGLLISMLLFAEWLLLKLKKNFMETREKRETT